MPKKHRRKEGDRVLYTPNQTQRYKSQWTRYQKGLALAESNNILQVEENVYRVPSERSPIGYWEITAGSSGGSVIYQSYGIAGRNADGLGAASILAGYGNNGIPNSIPPDTTLTYAELADLIQSSGAAYDEYINKEGGAPPAGVDYDYSYTIDRNANRNKLIATGNQNDPDPRPVYGSHTIAFDFIVPIDYATPTEATWSFSSLPLDSTPFSFPITAPSSPQTLTFPNTYNDFKIETVAFTFENPDANLIYSVAGYYETGLTVELTSLTGQASGYVCTCPDFSKFEDAFVPPPFESMASPRDWAASEAGAPVWADGKRRCYHIVGVQQVRGEGIPVPTDFPLGEA